MRISHHLLTTAPIIMESEKNQSDPSVWFLLLERGRVTGDFRLAARAQEELERLGVTVRYSGVRLSLTRTPNTTEEQTACKR